MIHLHYLDAYKIERQQEFDSLDEALRAFAGCITIPDYYPVTALLKDGEKLGYTGTIGDLYSYLQQLAQEER